MLHTDIPTLVDVTSFAATRQPGCVSIYVPTSPTDSRLGRIELKTLLSEAVARLRQSGMGRQHVDELHDDIAGLIDDSSFWQYQAKGLAVFATAGVLRTFRLPEQTAAVIEISDRFVIKPLLRTITFPRAALVLALAQNSVRLIEVFPDLLPCELVVPDLPTDIASTIGVPSIRGRAVPGTGRIRGSEGQKVRQAQYAHAIDQALRPVLAGRDLPLVIAAAEPMASIYRSVNSYGRLATETLPGNPEERSASELADAALAVVDSINAAELMTLRNSFTDSLGSERAFIELSDVARAATYGAVETLFVDIDQTIRGQIDDDNGAITFGDANDSACYDVVNEILRRALITGARILTVSAADVPAGGPCAAVLRFPTWQVANGASPR